MGGYRQGVWEFAHRCAKATNVEQIAAEFLAESKRLGFEHVALCSHVDPLEPPSGAVTIFEYPQDWLAYFSDQGFDRYDPVFQEASRRTTPFAWDDPSFLQGLNEMQRKILAEGADAGLANGITVPIKISGALPASCSIVANQDGVDPLSYPAAHSLAVLAHENARRVLGDESSETSAVLSPRERECLVWVARGKSDWTIGKLVGLSESGVHNAIERAKKRLGVASRTQAVVRAMLSGQLHPFEVAD